jgi:hypothetical protein
MSDAEPHPRQLLNLLDLARRAREASSVRELGFLLVNDTHQLVAFRQAAWCSPEGRVQALSGVLQPEANAPYAQWLKRLAAHLASSATESPSAGAQPVVAQDLPSELAREWAEWWPAHGLWLPLNSGAQQPAAALLLARSDPWSEPEQALLTEWGDTWSHALTALRHARPYPWWRPWGRSTAASTVWTASKSTDLTIH